MLLQTGTQVKKTSTQDAPGGAQAAILEERFSSNQLYTQALGSAPILKISRQTLDNSPSEPEDQHSQNNMQDALPYLPSSMDA